MVTEVQFLLMAFMMIYQAVVSVVKNPPANAGDMRDVGWEDPLKKEMATHSSTLAWRVSQAEEFAGYSP